MDGLKVELPEVVTNAIQTSVYDTFSNAKEHASKSEYPVYMNKKQACQYLNISNKTLSSWIKDGLLPVTKINQVYRFNRNELDKFMVTHIERG